MAERYYVQELKKNSTASFRILYNKYADLVYYLAVNMDLNPDQGEEIVQETFLKIWEKRAELDEQLSFKSYLVTIARNLILKMARRKAYDHAYNEYYKNTTNVTTNVTEDDMLYNDMMQKVEGMIDELPEEQRRIFLLRKNSDYSIREIADTLKISKRTVENQLYRANKKLLSILQAQKFISIAAIMALLFFL